MPHEATAPREEMETFFTSGELKIISQQACDWAKRGDVFVYFISGAKVRNPATAQSLIREQVLAALTLAPRASPQPRERRWQPLPRIHRGYYIRLEDRT